MVTRQTCSAFAFAAALGLVATAPAMGQTESPGARGERIGSCEKAAKAVRTGHPAHKEDAALDYLHLCGEAGASLTASALAGTRAETDTVALQRFYGSADVWRDADVMAAALQMVRDPGATVPARVYAVMHLLHLLQPSTIYGYAGVVAGNRVVTEPDGSLQLLGGCQVSGMVSDGGDAAATPLPIDYAPQIRFVLARLAADSTIPTPLRNAAKCGREPPDVPAFSATPRDNKPWPPRA